MWGEMEFADGKTRQKALIAQSNGTVAMAGPLLYRSCGFCQPHHSRYQPPRKAADTGACYECVGAVKIGRFYRAGNDSTRGQG